MILFLSDMELDRLEEILDPDSWDIAAALEQLGIDAIPDRAEQQLMRRHTGRPIEKSLYVTRAATIDHKRALLKMVNEGRVL